MKLLCQEYLKRNKIDGDFVFHCKKNTIFLKSIYSSKNPYLYSWRIFTVIWREQERHPGFYDFSLSQVFHNGIKNNIFLKQIEKLDMIFFEEYEKNILDFVQKIKKDGFYATSYNSQTLSAWEIFLIMCDSWFARNSDKILMSLIEKTIDKSLPISNRLEFQHKAEILLKKTKSPASDLWTHQIEPLLKQDNNSWLVDLIND